ncbi:quinoprotein relay system zinc metallohydrolase 2 (plasmid) [Paroceanicella profunda]|uniref:Quinoprotein relay system zinc metallohydrolase 2 n=1 Tax=Paroceanicella profunda TaxID=2579971 RepID=A0A5B8G328_9RHOB|nr:quinoprotein relay system zinc metallohydrolase 2 [Paroceanicella profunda]QDL93809.1 quinoprotein relay system zinc metallohydrolase 2 [Paroceanicella profunda]
MLSLLLTLCLAAQPETCGEHALPAAPCPEGAEAAAAAWLSDRPALTLDGWRCGAAPPLEVGEIAPGVFVHPGPVAEASPENGGDQANVGFIIGGEAVAVIDSGGSRAMGEALLAAIRARTELPVRWLILTHMHPDHLLGTDPFTEIGARLVVHARLPEALRNRAEGYAESWERQIGPRAWLATRVPVAGVTSAQTVQPGAPLSLDLGNRVLRVEAMPTAHTDNDLVVTDTGSGTLWLSDLAFLRHTPVVDGSVLGWLAVLDALSARPGARMVPGHGPVSEPWPEGLAPTRAYLTALVEETRAALRAGESMTDATRHLGSALAADWALFPAYNPRNATAVYKELEWE